MWDTPSDPTIYGFETLDVTETLDYLEAVSAISGVRVSMTALMVRIAARIYELYPDLNVIIANHRIQQRKTIDVFCQVAIPNKDAGRADLSGIKLTNVNELDIVEIHQALHQRAKKVRAGQDKEIESQKRIFDLIPPRIMRSVVKLVDYLTYDVDIDLDAIGVRSDPFGSCMVSSIAQFDLRLGFAPLVAASRCPLIFLPGAVYDEMRFVDGEPKNRKMVQISLTCDHRCFDGYQIGLICREFRTAITNPEPVFGPPSNYARHAGPSDAPPTPEDLHKRPSNAPKRT
jgi:hypothetical protein